jgi:hypothetical protein
MIIQNWVDIVVSSLQRLWGDVLGFVPSLLGALIVLIVGLVVAMGIGSLIERIIGALKLDALLVRLGVESYFERGGLHLDSGRFLGRMVYWFIVVVFLLAASDILGFYSFSNFLNEVLYYVPNVIVAVLIMLASMVLATFLRGLVRASVMGAKLHAAKFLGSLTWWAIVVFGLLTSLVQLGVAVSIINTVITGLIAMFALAGGLAFGLGGKEYAAHLLEKLRDTMDHRK